jgi:hypothetical protein
MGRFVLLFIIMVLAFYTYFIYIDRKHESKKASSNNDYIDLKNELVTEQFTIKITYDITYNGYAKAFMEVVRGPDKVNKVIFDGKYISMDECYHNYITIEKPTIEDLKRTIERNNRVTLSRISKIERNLNVININKNLVDQNY